ncbi:MAG: hypothetical protein WC243_02030 [Patescibacteria group bacterium]|jgi:hypothetical protein
MANKKITVKPTKEKGSLNEEVDTNSEKDPEVVAAALADLEAIESERHGFEADDPDNDGFGGDEDSGTGSEPF